MVEMPRLVVHYARTPWPVRVAHLAAAWLGGFIAALALKDLVPEPWLAVAATAASGLVFGYCLILAIDETRRNRARRASIARRLRGSPAYRPAAGPEA
jgi:hypothetical protein